MTSGVVNREHEYEKFNWNTLTDKEKFNIILFQEKTNNEERISEAQLFFRSLNKFQIVKDIELQEYNNSIYKKYNIETVKIFLEENNFISVITNDVINIPYIHYIKDREGFNYKKINEIISKYSKITIKDNLDVKLQSFVVNPDGEGNVIYWNGQNKNVERNVDGTFYVVTPGNVIKLSDIIINFSGVNFNTNVYYRVKYRTFPGGGGGGSKIKNLEVALNIVGENDQIISKLSKKLIGFKYFMFNGMLWPDEGTRLDRELKLINLYNEHLLNANKGGDKVPENIVKLNNNWLPMKYFDNKYIKLLYPNLGDENFGIIHKKLKMYSDSIPERMKLIFNPFSAYYLYYHIWDLNEKNKLVDEKLLHLMDISVLYNSNIITRQIVENKTKSHIILNDIYSFIIKYQFGEIVYETLSKKSEKLRFYIYNLLSKEQNVKILNYMKNLIKYREQFVSNKCKHFDLRSKYDNLIDNTERFTAFDQMIRTYGKDGSNADNKIIYCNLCGFNCACDHEKLLLERYFKNNMYDVLTEKLNKEYVTNNTETGEYVCKYCGRKIANADLIDMLQFDEETKGVLNRNIIEYNDENTVAILNNIRSVVTNIGVAGRINPRDIYKDTYSFINEQNEKLNTKKISVRDLVTYKKAWLYAYILAYVIHEIMKSKFKFNIRRELLQNHKLNQDDMKNIVKGNIDIYKWSFYKIIKDYDRSFLSELNTLHIPIGEYLIFAYRKLYKNLVTEDIEKNHSEFIKKNYHNIRINPNDYKLNKGDVVNDEDFINTDPFYNSKKMLKLFTKVSYINFTNSKNQLKGRGKDKEEDKGKGKGDEEEEKGKGDVLNHKLINRRFRQYASIYNYYDYYIQMPYHSYEFLNQDSYRLIYNNKSFTLKGKEIKWNKVLIKLDNEELVLDKKQLKEKIGHQKTLYELGYDINNLNIDFYTLDNITLLNINNAKQKSVPNVKIDELNSNELTDEQIIKIRKSYLKNMYISNLDYAIKLYCSQFKKTKEHIFGTSVNCSDEINTDIIENIYNNMIDIERKELSLILTSNKNFVSHNEVKFLKFDDDKIKGNIIDEKLINSLKKKLQSNKNNGSDGNNVINKILNIGRMIDSEKYDITKLVELYTAKKISNAEYKIRLNNLQIDYTLNNLIQIQNIIKQFIKYYRQIKCANSVLHISFDDSEKWIDKYILNDKNKLFTSNVLDYYNYSDLDRIRFDQETNYETKIKLSINMLLYLCDKIINNNLEIEFFVEFINIFTNNMNALDTNDEQINNIYLHLDIMKQKRNEKYLKMTPEEKLIAGLMDNKKSLLEQFEAIDELRADDEMEKELKEYDKDIADYNEEEELRTLEQEEDYNTKDDFEYEDEGKLEEYFHDF